MATVNKQRVACKETLHGGPPVQKSYPEAATQTFKKGEAVYLDGSGNVAEYTAGVDDGTQRFLGFAAEDGHNDTTAATHDCSVWVASVASGNVFEANVTTTGGADQTTAKTQVGTLYPMYQDTTNSIVMVDIADTGGQGDWLRVLEIVGTVGDTNGRVKFTVVPAACQVLGT